jgi:hypothetical protein
METTFQKAKRIKMFALVEQWQQSGLTQVEFCKTIDICPNTFTNWHNKYKKQPNALVKAFIPVTIARNEQTSCGEIEIHYPNGVRVVLPKNSDLSMVRTFINMV